MNLFLVLLSESVILNIYWYIHIQQTGQGKEMELARPYIVGPMAKINNALIIYI